MARFKERSIAEVFSGPEEFSKWIRKFSKEISARELILLSGDLGVGKTFFVTELVKSLGGENAVSPSFAIHNHYEAKSRSIDHIDLYRLKDLEDLESTGFWDLFAREEGVIVVEWANKLALNDFSSRWPIWEIKIDFENGDRQSSARKISCRYWV